MLINFINNNNYLYSNKKINNYQQANCLKQDVFTRTLSFKSANDKPFDNKSFDEFEKWAKDNNFLDAAVDIVTSSGKIIGSGFEGTTYGIPGTDNWIIKKYKRCDYLKIPNEKPKIIKVEDIAPSLNIGQEIARIEIPAANNFSHVYHILKKQDGKSIGVPYSESNLFNESQMKTHVNFLTTLANIPQESYNKCVKDIRYITQQGLEIDCGNPDNFLINTKNNTINFVDIIDKIKTNNTQYGEVLYSLLDGPFEMHIINGDFGINQSEDEIKNIDEILKKFFTAMKKENVKFSNGRFFDQLINSNIFNSILKTKTAEERIIKLKEMGLY